MAFAANFLKLAAFVDGDVGRMLERQIERYPHDDVEWDAARGMVTLHHHGSVSARLRGEVIGVFSGEASSFRWAWAARSWGAGKHRMDSAFREGQRYAVAELTT